MKRVLFCYDGPVMKDEDNNYYGSALNDDVFKRYKFFGNDISILIRVKQVTKNEAIKKFSLISKDYKIIEVPNINKIKGILFERKKALDIIEKEVVKHDYVIVRIPSSIGDLAIKSCKKNNKKYLVEVVGCIWGSLWNHSIKGKIASPMRFLQTKRSIKNSPFVIYVSNSFLQRRYPTKGNYIGCSDVCIKENNSTIITNRLEKIENTNLNKIVVGTCAAIDIRYKGQEYVIKALKLLKDNNINIEYQLVGGGNKNRLLKIAQKYGVVNNVKFIGTKPHSEVFEWYDNLDVYIQPSNQEGLCRSIIEAMSRGCPCVVSSAGGNPELIDSKYVFHKGNVKDLERKILELLSSKKNMLNQAKRNYDEAQKYEQEKLEKKRYSFYHEFKNSK